MATVQLKNTDTTLIDSAMMAIATQPAFSGNNTPGTSALYRANPPFFTSVFGNGFTYDAGGRLTGGTISSLEVGENQSGSGSIQHPFLLSVSGLSLPVQQAIAFASVPGSAAPTLLSGMNVVTAATPTVTLYSGDDTVTIIGNGTPGSSLGGVINVDGGSGINVAALPALRDQVTLSGGGRTESAVIGPAHLFPLTINLLGFSELRFIDGSVFTDDATPGAQAALVFLGILGRLPDPINAGSYALLARQAGTAFVADRLLATQEGHGYTANLGNAGYVTRLYNTILHRAPAVVETAAWQGLLISGASNRAEVAAAFASSPEAHAVNGAAFAGSVFGASPNALALLRVYETALNRPAETASLVANSQALDAGTTTLTNLETTVVTSPEFASLLHGATDNASFVNALQQSVYGQADQVTTDFYSHLLSAGQATRGSVLDAFAYSPGADAKILPLVTDQGVMHL